MSCLQNCSYFVKASMFLILLDTKVWLKLVTAFHFIVFDCNGLAQDCSISIADTGDTAVLH